MYSERWLLGQLQWFERLSAGWVGGWSKYYDGAAQLEYDDDDESGRFDNDQYDDDDDDDDTGWSGRWYVFDDDDDRFD